MVLSMDRWVEKVAVVTGASSGIGEAIAETLVEHGMTVIGIARRSELVEAKSKKLKGKAGSLHALKVDISKPEAIIFAFRTIGEKFPPIHVLVNNAGIVKKTSLVDGDIDMWKEVIDTNLLGLCVATREALTNMKMNHVDGHIVHINSSSGHQVPRYTDSNIYPATKFAVTGYTDSLINELTEIGSRVKITSISPGYVARTEIVEAAGIKMEPAPPAFLVPVDVANAVIYALSTPPHVQVTELMLRAVCDAN